MKNNWRNKIDKDDVFIFSIIKYYLETYFEYSQNDANRAFELFSEEIMSIIEEEYVEDHIINVFHNNSPWLTSVRVHHRTVNSSADWDVFIRKYPEPDDAREYFIKQMDKKRN